jgi:hypothetical protein
VSSAAIDPVLLTQEALRILSERMETAPHEIPAGGLLRLAESLTKLEMARLEKAPDEKGFAAPSILAMVRDSSLPDERKKELLLSERERLEDELEQVRAELEEL